MGVRILLLLMACLPAFADVVSDVRAAISDGDFVAGERFVSESRDAEGVTPEMLEALSWLGRGSLQAGNLDAAFQYAAETRELSFKLLATRELDAERHLPIALGASIEVQSHVMAQRGALSEAIAFLEGELDRWSDTSIVTRIQKNVLLLSLEGKRAPALVSDQVLGAEFQPISALEGDVVLLYFWAHWCPDCRFQAPILARLHEEYAGRGLRIVGPTQLYGYRSRGEDASPADELAWIRQVMDEHYATLSDMPVPVSADNFINFGCSTTPTLVLVDREGIVNLYHPGRMTYEELEPRIAALVAQ